MKIQHLAINCLKLMLKRREKEKFQLAKDQVLWFKQEMKTKNKFKNK